MYDTDLNLGVEFVRTDSKTEFFGGPAPKGETLLRDQHYHLNVVDCLKDELSGTEFELPVPVYSTQLKFPFRLYNPDKENLYQKYRTGNEVLNSRYNVFLIPISYTNDTLTVDLFLVYSKLNLNDGIQRWTPIKKRLSFISWSKIQLPKENWSANFSRQGEDYDIYGYSDFERYINEYLFITLETNNYWRK